MSTGVPGLDLALKGGLPAGSVTLVRGPSGAGKTILGNQICHHHVAEGGTALFVTLLVENHARMQLHMSQLGFHRQEAYEQQLHFISAFRILEEGGLDALHVVMLREIQRLGATLVVLDGFSTAALLAPDDLALQKVVHQFQAQCTLFGCTMILLSPPRSERLREAQGMVDCLIYLGMRVQGRRLLRTITFRKMRGMDFLSGTHAYSISAAGIEVFPRIESIVDPDASRHTAGPARSTGLATLDQLCSGGVSTGSTTLVIGPPGIGKTTLGMHFLEPCGGDETGLILGFYETPPDLAAKATRLGLNLEARLREGVVEMLWCPTLETTIDEILTRLVKQLRSRRPRRVFIDSVAALRQLVDEPDRLSAIFTALALELRNHGCTAMASVEVPTRSDPQDYALDQLSAEGVSAAGHNVVALRYLEYQNERRRTVSILKVRNQPLNPRVHLFEITDGGVHIEPESVCLPTTGFRPANAPERRAENP
ncbi:MAG: hypothetical protein K0Q76_3598 [Panacagrimonas sp.]|jgi:circadian clock protein KaiC|nr:hypothetical protein [Panacagrimonas sp.]